MSSLNELLTKSSIDYPEKEAVVCGEKRLSYSAISDASLKISNFLTSIGIKHGDRIGIFCNKDIEEVIVISAILRIGAVFIYINPHYREDQLKHVIDNCSIKGIFTDEAKSRTLAKAYPEKNPLEFVVSFSGKLFIDENASKQSYCFEDILKNQVVKTEVFEQVASDDPASIIYTSGSTGKAKGIIVTHKIFYESTVASAGILQNEFNDRLISVTPFAFDGALSQFFTMFYVGGTLVQQRSNFPKDIVETLLTEKITGFHAMPSLWNILLQKRSPFINYSYPDLRYISIIGESLPSKYLQLIRGTLKNTKIFKMYGTTEAFRSTYLPPEELDKKPGSVGIPFPGVEISIVDENNRVCEPGEIGEIVHRGNFISPGYWNLPQQTIERFKEDGLHTGDLGKVDEEGYLYIIGRKDGMIKVQGFRVSPEEIEICLYELKEIQEAVILNVPGENLDRKIKAVIVRNDMFQITEKEIISHCRKKLPNYMIPSLIEFREFLPRTANSKINKMELL
jgi:acyl-CoA synthetase (AMP-forming)/AMP-acid ligase II